MNNKEAIEWLKSIDKNYIHGGDEWYDEQRHEAIKTAIKALEEVKGLRLLVDWAVECGFGYDNIPEEYEKYKDEISDMDYTEGLIYIAMKEAEK